MSKKDLLGLSFGMKVILIWLAILTGFFMYDKMNVGEKINKVIILPPPIEQIEVEGGYQNDL